MKTNINCIINVFFVTIFAVCVLFAGCIGVYAKDNGPELEEVDEETRRTVFKNLELCVLDTGPSKSAIRCFDVDPNGNVAIGCRQFVKVCTVSVYDPEGAFLYGYRFKSYGRFGVELSDTVLKIYLIRGDYVVSVDRNGDLVEMKKMPDSSSSRDFMDNTVFAVRKTSGNAEYTLRNDKGPFNLLSSTYSRLYVATQDENERILYDVNSMQLAIDFCILVFVLAFITVDAIGITKAFKDARKRWRERRQNDPNCSPIDLDCTLEKLTGDHRQ